MSWVSKLLNRTLPQWIFVAEKLAIEFSHVSWQQKAVQIPADFVQWSDLLTAILDGPFHVCVFFFSRGVCSAAWIGLNVLEQQGVHVNIEGEQIYLVNVHWIGWRSSKMVERIFFFLFGSHQLHVRMLTF